MRVYTFYGISLIHILNLLVMPQERLAMLDEQRYVVCILMTQIPKKNNKPKTGASTLQTNYVTVHSIKSPSDHRLIFQQIHVFRCAKPFCLHLKERKMPNHKRT